MTKRGNRNLNIYQRGLLPAMVVLAPFTLIECAEAACTPATPVTDTVVTCTGATNNQNGTSGYGDSNSTRNTINVETGASVTGTSVGITGNGFAFGSFSEANTVNNFGVISGATGIIGQSGILNNKLGATVSGTSGAGFEILSQGTVANAGTISGTTQGVDIQNGTVTNTSTGTISGGVEGVTIRDDGLQSGGNPSVNNDGSITGGTTGVRFRSTSHFGELTNGGSVEATGANGVGVSFGGSGIVTNSGTIVSAAANARAINATGDVNVTNNSGGTISGRLDGIRALGTATVTNAQGALIESTEPTFIADAIFGVGNTTVQNSGTIRSLGLSASGIGSGAGLAVTNTTTGVITATRIGIFSFSDTTVSNEGLIEANSSFGSAIIGSTGVNVSNGSGTIRAMGGNNVAIGAGGTATVTNGSGLIQTTGQDSSTVFATSVKITGNSGTIEATGVNAIAVQATDTADVTNSGTIQSTGDNGIAIKAANALINNNAGGTIQGATGIVANNASTITSSGDINGFGGIAIQLGNQNDKVTLQQTGNVVGTIDFGAGNDLLNNDGQIFGSFTEPNKTTVHEVDGVRSTGTLTVINSHNINGGADRAAIAGNDLTVKNLSGGLIFGGSISTQLGSQGITANIARVENAGQIIAAAFGIQTNELTLTNFESGEVLSGGIGISAGKSNINNLGFIRGEVAAIAGGVVNLTNGISGRIETNSPNRDAIKAQTLNLVSNFGTIQSTGNSGIAISAGSAFINNNAGGAIIGNSGAIQISTGTINNAGTIQAIGAIGSSVFADSSANVFNTGTISGNIGIQAAGANNTGTVITNAGTIAGTGGTAIRLSPAADTLTLLPGSKIIGVVDMGFGADTVNIGSAVTITSRVSSFFKAAPVEIPVLINFTGTLNTNGTVNNPNSIPFVQAAGAVASLDPTAFGQADRALMNFTGGISSLVQGRLGGRAANGSAVQVMSFSPTGASSRTEEAFAAISAMGYAKERARPLTHSFTYADAPYNVWTSGFGGTSTQKGDDTMLRSAASAGAAVIGVDRQVRPDLLIGAFAGGGAGRLSVELNSQSVDTDYATGGVYGRFDWVSHFLDFTLQGGATTNKSKRLVLNGSAPGGSETATASYDSWYISPEIAYGRRYHFANGYTLTPLARIRYLAGKFDGYNEAGSVQNLVVNRRTLHDLEERAEVELSKITGVGAGSFRTNVHGGLIALQRLGNPAINTVLIGQDLSFATPGKASSAGVVAGAGFDFRATERMSLFGAVEATVMSDRSRTAAGKAGLIFAF
jgi:uncharacterized protein with beta-barrel porin domain